MDKTLIVVLDSFSERVLDYSNVTLFDYGFLHEFTEYDYTSNGVGFDESVTTFTDTVGGFYEVTLDDVQYSADRDIDFLSESTVQTDQNGEALARVFSDFIRVDQGPEEDPNHGDWVIETINQTLQFPEQTEIIAIDLDTLSFGGQWGKAIEVVDYTFGAESFSEPRLATVLFNFLDTYDSRYNSNAQNTYLPVAMSASFGEQQVIEGEVSALEYFEFLEVPIFQASANTGQGGVDWGSVYKNVVNVGAWNAAENGELLLASNESLANVDLAGDGIVTRDDWGTNFGTSFATPRIAAEFANLATQTVIDLNTQGGSIADFVDTTLVPPAFSDLVVNAVPALTTELLLSFQNPEIEGGIVVPVSSSTIAANGLDPRILPGADSGLTGSALSSVTVFDRSTSPSPDADVLTGTTGSDTLSALGGDDVITALRGDDIIDGGDGTDTAIFSGLQFSYTLTLAPGQTTLSDRRPEGNGTDALTNIEFLDFGVNYFTEAFNLAQFGGVTGLSPQQFESFIELYIAYFNRAPDAIGLNFWGTAFANGTSLEAMASLFVDQDETRSTYPDGSDNTAFATSVYDNVLGRTPDQAGIDFWVGQLDANAVTRDQFILEVLRGAKSELKPDEGQAFVDQQIADRAYLENKVDVGAYFAVHRGMSNVENATASMALFNGTQESIGAAISAIDGYYQSSLDPYDGDFLMPVVGILDNGFVA